MSGSSERYARRSGLRNDAVILCRRSSGLSVDGIAEQRENVGVGKQPAERVEHLFAAAAIEQPVVDDGGAHTRQCSAGIV